MTRFNTVSAELDSALQRVVAGLTMLLCAFVLSGCEISNEGEPIADNSKAPMTSQNPAPNNPSTPQPTGQPAATNAAQPGESQATNSQPANSQPDNSQSANTPPTNPPAQPEPNTVRDKAAPGVTGKGNYEAGIITTPLKEYFQIRDRIAFEIQIPHAMNLYNADKGRYPRSHEEFMRDIIEANSIQLPELPMGHRYVYDPKTHELMVEHPAPQ